MYQDLNAKNIIHVHHLQSLLNLRVNLNTKKTQHEHIPLVFHLKITERKLKDDFTRVLIYKSFSYKRLVHLTNYTYSTACSH